MKRESEIIAVVAKFAALEKISLDDALEFFYHSDLYQLVSQGVSDMHCMSDEYLAEELDMEYRGK